MNREPGLVLSRTFLWRSSPRFPARHGFTTRQGGVSEGPFASLNLSRSTGDSAEKVAENLRRVRAAAGVGPAGLHLVSQVHGAAIHRVGPEQAQPPASRPEADALLTAEPGIALGIQVADCVPILLADPEGRRVAAVHSGWRGTAAEIAARAVEALAREGARPQALHAAIGPSIRVCCYAVGADLAERFRAQFGPEVVVEENGQLHLDLVRAIRTSLHRAGVQDELIDVLPDCTSCDPDQYYSHRRDKGVTGRHLAVVVNAFDGPGAPGGQGHAGGAGSVS